MPYTVAGIDIHKKVLMVVVLKQIAGRAEDFQRRRFGTAASELQRLTAWLREQGVKRRSWNRLRSTGSRCGMS